MGKHKLSIHTYWDIQTQLKSTKLMSCPFSSFSAGTDYFPPIERYVVPAGSTRVCLTFTILDDEQVEGMESLRGFLEGIITGVNILDPNPDRITFNPREATLNVLDTDSKCGCCIVNSL